MASNPPPIESVSVIGAGRMGHGIALVYALAGRDVTLFDVDEAVLESAPRRIRSALQSMVEAEYIDASTVDRTLATVRTEPSFPAAVADVDFVTEAVAEDLEIKQAVFADLDEHAPDDAILATNTSGLSIAAVSRDVTDTSRVLGTHWFNPPYIVPLVEIVKGPATTESAADAVYELLESADKTPITLQREIPGFIGNRIQAAMSYEAFSLLARGVASAEDIDRAVKAGFGFRLPILGIFEKMDQSGLEIHHEVERQLLQDLDRGTDPNAVIAELLETGATGWESGKGVYDWSGVDIETVERDRDRALLSLLSLYEDLDAGSSPPANYTPDE